MALRIRLAIARIFLTHASTNARVYRVGGDEFAIMFRDTSETTIRSTLQAIQEEIHDYPYGKDVNISFSAGVVPINLADRRRRFTDFYEAADRLLYEAKTEGKGIIQF